MSKFMLKAGLEVGLFTVLFAVVHYYLIHNTLSINYSAGPVWIIYAVLIPMTLVTVFISALKFSIDKTSVGKTYLALVVIKIVVTIAFFYPWLFPKTEFSVPLAKQFFALFFPLLFIELKLLVGLLNKSLDENKKSDENQ